MGRKRRPKESDYLPKRGNPLQETVCYRLGGTVYEVHTSCGGTEPLYDKMVRLITRVLYFFFIGKRAILTNGFVKKTQKTPPAAIELARKYKADYERRFGR